MLSFQNNITFKAPTRKKEEIVLSLTFTTFLFSFTKNIKITKQTTEQHVKFKLQRVQRENKKKAQVMDIMCNVIMLEWRHFLSISGRISPMTS